MIQNDYFIGVPSSRDMGDKILLFCGIIQLYNHLRSKKPGVTIYQVIMACVGKNPSFDTENARKISEICEWLMYECNEFPDTGISLKDLPEKIKNILSDMLPF